MSAPIFAVHLKNDTHSLDRFVMQFELLARFSVTDWFFSAWGELVRYFNSMDTTQWGVVSACAVAFGFLCLKGTALNR